MPVTDYDALDVLCATCGIAGAYHDIWGIRHQASTETKQSLLGAIGLPVSENADIHRALEQEHLRDWERVVAPVLVVAENESPLRVTLTLEPSQTDKAIHWELNEETGEVRRGDWMPDDTSIMAERIVGEIRLKRFEVPLFYLPVTGYHHLIITTADGTQAQTSLIVVPQSCYQPPELDRGCKLWGIALQLYALRSCRNWGIGDFADLHSAIDMLAPLGVNIIGLNPLHALFPHLPERASPYSPTSRDFLNPLYLNIEAIDEYQGSGEVQRMVASKEFQVRLKALRQVELVDYAGVWSAKLEALIILYRCFRQKHIAHNSARAIAFREFQAEGGTDLHEFALFEALQAHFHRQDAAIGCWWLWPELYRNPGSNAVADWAASNTEKVEFHLYLQWNTELQFAEAQMHCSDLGMTVGIYRDLAVGVAKAGAQTWAAQPVFALESSIGAPPDDFNLDGQDWKLPPPKPQALIDNAYSPFIKTLRANMRNAGALRIDHVMGLMRLFWVPPKGPPEAGTYLAYPFTDLLGILALESQRNQCLIIGEDLGTVPDDIRSALKSKGVLAYRILYFEKNWHQRSFNSPADYPSLAVASVGSHDLPTLSGFWQESDLDMREKLDLFPSAEHRDQLRYTRARDRDEIISALERENLMQVDGMNEEPIGEDLSSKVILPVHRYLARSRAMLMMVQLEDLFCQKTQVNLPGTIDEYPNWRGKLLFKIEDWLDQGRLEYYAQAIERERNPAGTK